MSLRRLLVRRLTRRLLLLLACGLTLVVVARIEAVAAVFTASAPVGANTLAARNSFGLTQSSTTSGCISEDGNSGACIDGLNVREAAGVAVTSDGEFAYVAVYAGDGVASFDRDPATGTLSQLSNPNGCMTNAVVTNCTQGRALDGVWDVALSPDDKFLYAVSYTSDAVAVFSRNLTTGVLTQLSSTSGCVSKSGGTCATGAALGGATGLAMSPDGNYLYVASYDDDGVVVFSRNSTTGVLTHLSCTANTNLGNACTVGRSLGGATELVVSPNGGNLYVASSSDSAVAVFTRNSGTGAVSQPANATGCFNNTGSGTCTSMGSATLSNPYDLVVSPDGAHVYVAAVTSDAVNAFTRDATTGLLTRLSCVSETGTSGACADGVALDGIQAVAISPDGQDVYTGAFQSDAVAVFKRDASTGAITQWPATRACIANTNLGSNCVVGKGFDGLHKMTVSPDGKDVYTGGSGSTSTGYVTVLGRRR